MKRRGFVVSAIIALGALKAVASKAKKSPDENFKNSIFEIFADHKDVIYLKRNSVVKLPENPLPIESLLHFNLVNYRFGKSPVIQLNGHKINGTGKVQVNVVKDLHLKKAVDFYLQYTGHDIGWIVLS